MTDWQNRIVGEEDVAPDQLNANPLNWRVHPSEQQDALAGVLDEVGWVQRVIVNKRTNTVVDGHLRVMLALRRDESTVPVQFVDLDEREEALVLATLDPLAALAVPDSEILNELLQDVATSVPAVQAMLGELAEEAGAVKLSKDLDTSPQLGELDHRVVVFCEGESHQRELVEQFEREGLECQALIL